MSIVFMECSIEMYYTKRSGGRSSERKNEWENACLFRKLLFATSLPPGPLDRGTKSVVSRPVPIMILVNGGPLSTAGRIPTLASGWLPHRAAAHWQPWLSTQSELELESPRPQRLNCLDGSGSASTARLYQVRSTSPAWAESNTHWQAGPCHFRPWLVPSQIGQPQWLGPPSRPRAACNPADGLGCHWQCVSPLYLQDSELEYV
jgi:hypothetical protein